MNECDQAYMQTKGRKPEPEEVEGWDDWFWYLAGASLAVTILAYIAVWIVEGLT